MEKGWCECRNRPDKELEAEKRRWSWEKEYEGGQGIRMSQDYVRCRNGKNSIVYSCNIPVQWPSCFGKIILHIYIFQTTNQIV